MTIERKLLGTTPVSSGIEPEAVSFDGTNDYLKRTSDMTGNADGKTWTFSAWVYNTGVSQNIYSTYQSRFQVICQGNYFTIAAKSSTEDVMFASYPNAPLNTWNHILISCNQASTSQRHIYINGVAHTAFNTYVNGNIDFTETQHYIGAANANHIYKLKGRLAHVYLDKTYRDLSVTSNRRLFITAEGKPADSDTLAALNPIMYMPLVDAATAGSNSGTGGDFTAVGTLATAERGPNQDNCSASTFDGTGDYLSRSLMSGASDSKTFTYAGVVRTATNGNNSFFEMYNTSTGAVVYMLVSSVLTVVMEDASGQILSFSYSNVRKEQSLALAFSLDLTDVNKRHVIINGVDVTSSVTFSNYTNRTVPFSTYPVRIGGDTASFGYATTSVGETYFNTTYIDLSADNPFWDSTANRPNSVRKVIEDTGVTPLIAMPLMGNDAGNNLGSGGDFSVNSGPFTGARGGSEFWARSADFSSTNHLSKSSSWGDSGNYTFAVAFRPDNTSGTKNLFVANDPHAAQYGLRISQDDAKIEVQQKNTSNANFINAAFSGLVANTWYVFLASFSVNASKFSMEIRGGVTNSYSTTSLNNTGQVRLQGTTKIGGGAYGNFDGDIGFVYLSKGYVDISQESNRNKFVDQLGYPKDLTPLIDAGDIPSPVVYMKLDPSVSLGTNSGTGGDFTVSGTLVAGADVDP